MKENGIGRKNFFHLLYLTLTVTKLCVFTVDLFNLDLIQRNLIVSNRADDSVLY